MNQEVRQYSNNPQRNTMEAQLLNFQSQLDRRKLVYLVGTSHPDRRGISQVAVPPAGALLDRNVDCNLLGKAEGGMETIVNKNSLDRTSTQPEKSYQQKDECKRNANRVINHLSLEVWTGLTGRRLPGRQCLPA